jgi:nucleoside transporter
MADTTLLATPLPLKIRLYAMMFLQYFVQGCYLPVISVYLKDTLGFDTQQLGWFGSALAVGPLFMPFFLGQVVDRHVATQWVLAFCHLTGGLLMLAIYTQTDFWPVAVLGTLYSILYVPTLMLTNSVAFYHLKNSQKEFPLARLWGTLGFVVPAWVIEQGFLAGLTGDELKEARGIIFLLAGSFGILMAVYCLTLPNTPAQPSARTKFAPSVVLGLLRRRDFLLLVAAGMGIAICHKFYFVLNSPYLRWVLENENIREAVEQRISSIGQISEILVMAALGRMLTAFGFRQVFALGLAAYMLRCLIFAGVAWMYDTVDVFPWTGLILVCLGQSLHGFCFVCFWAAAFIYVDKITEPSARGSMQNFFGTLVFGLGMFIGGFISGAIGNLFTTGSGVHAVEDWVSIWLVCGGIAAACWIGFLMSFPANMLEKQPLP